MATALSERAIIVQGSIDLLCFYADGSVEICDYKTDYISPEEKMDITLLRARMQEKHGDQLAQYAASVEETFGKRPIKAYVYSLPLGDAIEITLP